MIDTILAIQEEKENGKDIYEQTLLFKRLTNIDFNQIIIDEDLSQIRELKLYSIVIGYNVYLLLTEDVKSDYGKLIDILANTEEGKKILYTYEEIEELEMLDYPDAYIPAGDGYYIHEGVFYIEETPEKEIFKEWSNMQGDRGNFLVVSNNDSSLFLVYNLINTKEKDEILLQILEEKTKPILKSLDYNFLEKDTCIEIENIVRNLQFFVDDRYKNIYDNLNLIIIKKESNKTIDRYFY